MPAPIITQPAEAAEQSIKSPSIKSPKTKSPQIKSPRPAAAVPVAVPASTPTPAAKPAEKTAEKQLSGAELKKLKQAEKQAKRAQAKAASGVPTDSSPQTPSDSQAKKPTQSEKPAQKGQKPTQPTLASSSKDTKGSQKPSPAAASPQSMPVRTKQQSGAPTPVSREPEKRVALFGHLYSNSRRLGLAGAAKEVHPAVAALGLQMSSYDICGSTARCVAMLLAFKSVIASYTTPQGTSLARHLIPHVLSPQIEYLISCRPLSISMGNAIRYLKQLISEIDPSVPDHEAKILLLDSIDLYVRERITAADGVIAETAAQKIVDGDVIVTYAKSSLVLKTLLEAKRRGKEFSVVCLDAKPLFEGKRLAMDLCHAGIKVSYALISAAAHFVPRGSKVFLGAHAMMANGRLYSRVGTAITAMLAYDHDIPVIVLSESIKFTDKVALDSIVGNEVGPAEELILPQADSANVKGPKGAWEQRDVLVEKWEGTQNLQMLNILYDVTPAEYIKMIVTEHGVVPPSSVPAVLRMLEGGKGGM